MASAAAAQCLQVLLSSGSLPLPSDIAGLLERHLCEITRDEWLLAEPGMCRHHLIARGPLLYMGTRKLLKELHMNAFPPATVLLLDNHESHVLNLSMFLSNSAVHQQGKLVALNIKNQHFMHVHAPC